MFLFFCAVLLCVPLRIFVPALGVEIAPADVLCVIAFPYVLFFYKKINKWLLATIFFSSVSLLYVQIFFQPGNIGRALLSLGFFFKPYFIYLLGRSFGEKSYDFEKIGSMFVFLLSTTALLATLDAVFIKGHVATFAEFERIPGEFIFGGVFDPTFLGVKFHGSNGINGIAVFFSFAFMVCLSLGVIMKPPKRVMLISYVGMICSLILVLGSGSRQAVFGLMVCCFCCFFSGRMTSARVLRVFFYFIFGLVSTSLIISYFSEYFVELFAKVLIMLDNIYSGNWDGVSSGRLGLYVILFDDLLKSPIFGTGFSGYGIFDSELGYFDNDVSTSGYTPHNQYLGALWKMGGLTGVFYFIFLWSIIRPFFNISQKDDFGKRLYIAMSCMILPFFTVFNLFQDGISSPSTGPIFLFILGFYTVRLIDLKLLNLSADAKLNHSTG